MFAIVEQYRGTSWEARDQSGAFSVGVGSPRSKCGAALSSHMHYLLLRFSQVGMKTVTDPYGCLTSVCLTC